MNLFIFPFFLDAIAFLDFGLESEQVSKEVCIRLFSVRNHCIVTATCYGTGCFLTADITSGINKNTFY